MGNLITETPYSEITATMELPDRLGVGRYDLKRFRKAGPRLKAEVAKLLKHGFGGGTLIDCDADPTIPHNGWTVFEHQKGGQFTFDPSNIEFCLDESQTSQKSIQGASLLKNLASKSVLNANVLDYLLANPDLIPEEWKTDERGNTRYIFFRGTVYRNSDGSLCIRYLYWSGGRRGWSYGWWGTHDGALNPRR